LFPYPAGQKTCFLAEQRRIEPHSARKAAMSTEIFESDDYRIIPDPQFSGLLGVHGDTVARKDKRIARGEEIDDLWPRPIQISARRKGRRAADVRRFLAAKSGVAKRRQEIESNRRNVTT
jgi:hypothetical protein